MPRRNVNFVQRHYYHIYNRGAGRHNLFIEKDNYLYVLRQTKKYLKEFALVMIAYCLMPNHYHFLIRQDGQIPAGELPKRVFGGYSRAVNRRYQWTGTLFEGRFQARHVDNDNYLRHLCRYIHANPVKDGLVNSLEAWPYSNYLEWVGLRQGTLVDYQFIRDIFGDGFDYEAFVQDYLATRQLPDELNYLG
ncbi:MAG TPA: transposase [Chloroflexi bacterium]|nr:transposase [Chloroflexota bacterium]